MFSNLMWSGPGAKSEEEDFMAFWISSVVTFGHGSWWLVGLVASLIWETGDTGKRAWQNTEAFSRKVVAVAL
jgi:hypothetical protein